MKQVTIILVMLLCGCGSHIVGGQSRRDTGTIDVKGGEELKKSDSYEVLIPTPNGPIIYRSGAASAATTQPSTTESYDRVATTQSSVSSDSGLPQIGSADEGEIAGVKFKVPGYSSIKNAWWLGLIILAVGGLFLYQRKWVFGGIVAIIGMITCLQPIIIIVGGVVILIGFGVYWLMAEREKGKLHTDSQRIVGAMNDALDVLPPNEKIKAETVMSRKLDRAEKISVSKLKHS